MPKAESGSVKDIAKRIKSKGLQKLKFFCQMCEKQCRDANGFKCHLTSESHLRQMKIFSENARGIMDQNSKMFEKIFLDTLRMRHMTTKTNANNLYQEIIRDRSHIHMNATMWASLSDFCKYLGKTGKCVVEETDRGWYVTYIERDAGKMAREQALAERQAAEAAAENALQERLEQQRVEAAKALDRAGGTVHLEATALEGQPSVDIQLSLKMVGDKKNKSLAVNSKIASVFGESDSEEDENNAIKAASSPIQLPPLVPLSRKQEEPSRKRQRDSTTNTDNTVVKSTKSAKTTAIDEPWIHKNIIVRIINKDIADGKFFKRKAVIDRVVDEYTAETTVLDSGPDDNDGGDVLRLDQRDIETVVPKQLHKRVRILRGKYRGYKGEVTHLDKKRCKVDVELPDGKVLSQLSYDDIAKVA